MSIAIHASNDELAIDRLPSLEDASQTRLLGTRVDFYGFGGQCLGTVPTNALRAIQRVLDREQSTRVVQEQLAAIAVILDERKTRPVATDGAGVSPGEIPDAPDPAPDPDSLVALSQRIADLLQHQSLSAEDRQAVMLRLRNREYPSAASLRFEIDRLTATLNIAV